MTGIADQPGARPSADEALGRIIHVAMWERRITQAVLAAKLGIDQTTVSKKLHGLRPWSVKELLDVADFLGMDARDLLGNMWGPQGLPPVGKPTVAYVAPYLASSTSDAQQRASRPRTGHLSLVA